MSDDRKVPDPAAMSVDPVTGAMKELKADRYDLIPPEALEFLAKIYGKSCKDHGGKYDARNWEKGYAWGKSFRALIGHAFAAWRGEWLDPESGLPHFAHAAWHCLTLITYHDHKLGTDDRSPIGRQADGPNTR
jgi:hypothetical protein